MRITLPGMASSSVAVASSRVLPPELTFAALASTAAEGFTVTAAVWVIAVPFAVADTVFASATVELSVPVATPLAFVVPLGCVRTLPLPVAASATVAPLIGLLFASLAVTVIVDVPVPAAIEEGAAATVDCAAETGPGFTVTDAVCEMATPFAVGETVLACATLRPEGPRGGRRGPRVPAGS